MGNLGDSLNRHANRLGIARQVEAVGVVEQATEEIARFIPRDDFEVISFKDGVLKIGTESAAVKNEIQMNLNLKKIGAKRVVFAPKQTEKEL